MELMVCGEGTDLMGFENVIYKASMGRWNHGLEICFAYVALASPLVLHRHDCVYAVGLSIDALIDPVEGGIEFFG